MAQIRYAGSIAPPLSDEKLAAYRVTIDALPPSPVKDALRSLYDCCAKWWDLPDSVGTEMRAHPSGTGTVIPLEAKIVAVLDEHIPWEYELNALGGHPEGLQGLFDPIQSAETARNSEKLSAWRAAIGRHVFAHLFPGKLSEEFWETWNKLVRTAQQFGAKAEEVAAALTAVLYPGEQLEDLTNRVMRYQAEVTTAWRAEIPPIARPALEDTTLRDTAFHLLWHVRELALSREPLTSDKI